MLRLQSIALPADTVVFGEALLQRDAGLFDEWYLRRHLGIELDCDDVERLQLVQRRLMDNALAQARVSTHRDYMPRNLMPVADGPAVLDFQDMVIGPIAYDPVSLLRDAFLSWPEARVDAWLRRYHARALAAVLPVPDIASFLRAADWLGAQRHLKLLGIFSRLHHRDAVANRCGANRDREIGGSREPEVADHSPVHSALHGLELACNRLEALDGRLSGRYLGGDRGRHKDADIRSRSDLSRFDRVQAYGDRREDRPMLAMAHERW